MNKLKIINIYMLRVFYFCIQSVFQMKKYQGEDVKNILLVRLNHIGDLLITLPTVYSIKKHYPDARITLVTGVWNKGLAEFQRQLFDEILYFNKKDNCRSEKQVMSKSERLDFFSRLKKAGHDLCFDFDGDWDFLKFYRKGGVKYLSSASYLRFHQNLEQLHLVKNRYNYNIHTQHESDNLFETASVLGITDSRSEFSLQVSEDTDKKVSEYFSSFKNGKTVGIHPIASISEKMWTVEGFAAAADFLIERDFSVVFFGAPADKEYIGQIISAMKSGNEVNIATDFNLGEFITGVGKCDYFISLDSLAQHVVQYYRKTAVVLYLIENSARWSTDNDNLSRLLIKTDEKSVYKVLEELDRKFG